MLNFEQVCVKPSLFDGKDKPDLSIFAERKIRFNFNFKTIKQHHPWHLI